MPVTRSGSYPALGVSSEPSNSSLSSANQTPTSSNQSITSSEPTPPPSPSKNRKSPTNQSSTYSSTSSLSPSTSPKNSTTGSQQMCPGSPSRNYRYYTSSSAELTPPGSPAKQRNTNSPGSGGGSVIANKNNTVVWHQATPPGSPKRSFRKPRNSTANASTRTGDHKTPPSTRDSSSSKNNLPAKVAELDNNTSVSQNGKNSSCNTPSTNKASTKMSPSRVSKKTNLASQSIPEEKIHKKQPKPIPSRELQGLKTTLRSNLNVSTPDFVVKITSPTSPPKAENNNIPDERATLNRLSFQQCTNSKPNDNITASAHEVSGTPYLRMSERNKIRLSHIYRQSSLPDDGYLHPYDSVRPRYSGIGSHCNNVKAARSHGSQLDNQANGYPPAQFAKIDGTVSDNSFNSATLSYATLFYAPRPPTRPAPRPPVSVFNNNGSQNGSSQKSIHIVRLTPQNSTRSKSLKHSLLREGDQKYKRMSNSTILRQRFANHNSRSLDMEEQSERRLNNKHYESIKDSNVNITNGEFVDITKLTNAPSLPILNNSSESNSALDETSPSPREKNSRLKGTSKVAGMDSPRHRQKNSNRKPQNLVDSPGSPVSKVKAAQVRSAPSSPPVRKQVHSEAKHSVNESSTHRKSSIESASSRKNSRHSLRESDAKALAFDQSRKSGTGDTINNSGTRPCQLAANASPQKMGASNVPSWMRQTISRILASTSPPYSRKSVLTSRRLSGNNNAAT